MKLLLDESLPQDLRLHFPGHEAVTVPFRGWASRRNGELLELASAEFDVFVTADQNLEHQQNVAWRLTGEEVPQPAGWQYSTWVSPTVFRKGGFRFFFFSREEPRMHVHVHHEEGEAKFWLEPEVELARNHGLSRRRVAAALALVRRHEDEIRSAWGVHFGR